MKDLRVVKKILGMEIHRDQKIGELYFSQKKYIEKVLKCFGMQGLKPMNTPLATPNFQVLLLGTLDYFVPMPWISQGACIYPQTSLNLPQRKTRYSKTNIDTIEILDLEKKKSHTFDSNVLELIPIDVDNSKVIMDLVTP